MSVERICETCGAVIPLKANDWYHHQLTHIEEDE